MGNIALLLFCLGYVAIAFEHKIKINKAAPALLTGVLCWVLYFLNFSPQSADSQLNYHISEIASILFFLMGAMTIVELIDAHDGFEFIIQAIWTKSKSNLLVLISLLAFFLSSLLDNLTTTIVLISIIDKILSEREDKLWFSSLVVIAANAGGVWSPLGDVTTTMLWIGGQISAANIIVKTFIPSLFVCGIPTVFLMYKFKNITFKAPQSSKKTNKESNLILFLGLFLLLFVPAFKTLTHTPPFLGMLLSLAIIWIAISILHKKKTEEIKQKMSVNTALQKIDMPSILFFLGILLGITALQSFEILGKLAHFLDKTFQNDYLIGIALGILSAIVDNVPLVAAAQGMYSLEQYPKDHVFWEFLALTTGTGGSMISIGSAAGVAAMGLQKIDFLWYLKKITGLAAMGFIGGVIVFILGQMI